MKPNRLQASTPVLAAALGVLALAAAIALSACGGDGAGTVLTPVPSPSPLATIDPSLPAYLQTPIADRRLPEGVYALAWAGQGEVTEVRFEPLLDGYEVQVVATGLSDPAGLAFLPDGRALVTEQHTGQIRMIENDALRDEPFARIDNVAEDALELGLLGIAVDPEFDANRWVYVFYVEAGLDGKPVRSVLARLTERDGFAFERTELAAFPPVATDVHTGGGLKFGPDGRLYVTIGDMGRQHLAPDPAEPEGKILRLNRDGSAPDDNPFAGRADADPRVFATGFRNLFGIAFHPDLPGRAIAPDNAVGEGDELNIVEPGGHYGWAGEEGTAPIWQYLNPVGPAGAEVYTSDRLPRYTGDFFFCQFHHGGVLHRVRFSDDFSRVESDTALALGCGSTIAQGPDGWLYFLDRMEGVLYRIAGP
ncbi:MAG: PQQ-dependent sugar dehydrogenase [Dehalococcoidia bacterium]